MTASNPGKAAVTIKGLAVLDSVNAIKARSGDQGYERIVATLDDDARGLFRRVVLPTTWYPLDAFVRLLGADVRETAGGNERVLIERSEVVIDKQLRGIYRLFVKLGSPEFVLKRIAIVHMTYFTGVQIENTSLTPGRAVIRYTGFEPQHQLIGYTLIGFYRKALQISGAKNVQVGFSTPIGDGKAYAELVATWS
ncbi:MAG TPA: hypothetical protein VLU43_11165 [Anaeromyxobacteraceae bacterium]|nr:hypothetical protein [Anaeromyxobacteraceae bacterium]